MSGLRKLERSVIMHKSYKICGNSSMFHKLWKQYHCKNNFYNTKIDQTNENFKKPPKKSGILSKIKDFLFSKKKNNKY